MVATTEFIFSKNRKLPVDPARHAAFMFPVHRTEISDNQLPLVLFCKLQKTLPQCDGDGGGVALIRRAGYGHNAVVSIVTVQ